MNQLYPWLAAFTLCMTAGDMQAQNRGAAASLPSARAHTALTWQRGALRAAQPTSLHERAGGAGNDDCSGAIPLTLVPFADCGTGSTAGDNSGGTDSGPMSCDESSSGFQDVWYTFNSGENTAVRIDVDMITIEDLVIQVLDGCAGTEVACDIADMLTVTTTPNTDYKVRIASNTDWGDGGTYNICASYMTGGSVGNDSCADVVPQDLAAGSPLTFTGTTAGATNTGDFEPGSELEGGNPTVWHAFTTTECSNVTISYCGITPVFGNVWVFLSPGCPAGNDYRLADNYNFTTCPDGNATITYQFLPAGTYYVPVMQDVEAAYGPYAIDVTATACGEITEYCIPNPSEGPTDGDFIQTVVLGDINYSGPNDVNYVDNTTMTTNLALGGTYSITITGGTYEEDVYAAWIDYNDDFFFDPATEKLGEFSTTTPSETQNITFTVPAGTTLGTKRLRVRCAYGANSMNACTDYSYGETEDYSVEIVLGTGVADATLPSIGLYPNPSNGTFTVNAGEFHGAVQVEVADMSGRLAYSGQHMLHTNRPLTLALEGKLAQGSYLLRLVAEQGMRTIPLMVK